MAMRIASVLPSRKQLLRFAFTPQFGGNFRSLSRVFLALVQTLAHALMTAGLIERSHPVFLGNMGGLEALGRVMVDAAANLKWNRKSLPQVIIYFAVAMLLTLMVAAVVIMFAQLFISVALAADPAAAAGGGDGGILYAANDKARDWLLCILPTDDATPCPASVEGGAQLVGLAKAVAAMLAYYSTGCMVLAGIIVTYEVTAIVVETAKEGVLFGKRHNELWAPIRLVFAIAILTPLPNGFNSGQIAIVKFATWGSGFASNVWAEFVNKTSTSDFLYNTTAVSTGLDASMLDAVEKALVAETLRQAFYVDAKVSKDKVSVASINVPWDGPITQTSGIFTISRTELDTGLVNTTQVLDLPFPDPKLQARFDGSVFMPPLRVTFPVPENIDTSWVPASQKTAILTLAKKNLAAHRRAFVLMAGSTELKEIALQIAKNSVSGSAFNPADFERIATSQAFWTILAKYRTDWHDTMRDALRAYQTEMAANTEAKYVTEWGWVGAGGWILQLSSRIQALKSAVQARPNYEINVPQPVARNFVMRGFEAAFGKDLNKRPKMLADTAKNAGVWLQGVENAGPPATLVAGLGKEMLAAKSAGASSDPLYEQFKDKDAMNALLTYLQRTLGDSGNPLVALIDLGWTILVMAGGILAAAAVMGADGFVGTLLFAAFVPMFTAGVVIAILFPLLPTLRFAFGMMSWVLAILEAVFAVPIVALAHLRTDGAGLMGPMAQSAYLLLLQIFVRPSLMVMGLIGGLLVFSVTVQIVNTLFMIALIGYPSKWGGYYIIGFASIFIYASMLITIANMCFKMIDMVPDTILRWIGGGGMSGVHDVSFARDTAIAVAGVSTGVIKVHRDAVVAQKGAAKAITDSKAAQDRESFVEFNTRKFGDPESGKRPQNEKDYAEARKRWGALFDVSEARKKNNEPSPIDAVMARLARGDEAAPGETPLRNKSPEEQEFLTERAESGSGSAKTAAKASAEPAGSKLAFDRTEWVDYQIAMHGDIEKKWLPLTKKESDSAKKAWGNVYDSMKQKNLDPSSKAQVDEFIRQNKSAVPGDNPPPGDDRTPPQSGGGSTSATPGEILPDTQALPGDDKPLPSGGGGGDVSPGGAPDPVPEETSLKDEDDFLAERNESGIGPKKV